MKECSKCKRWKDKSEFYLHYQQLRSECKSCSKKCAKKYIKEHHEEHLKKCRQWKKNNPEKVRLQRVRENLTYPRRFRAYKGGAKRRNLKWDLTFDEFKSFWQKPCHYCGYPIETIGLDRIDNKKGYSMDNIVSCCLFCNISKGRLSKEEFIDKCRKIVHYHNRR